MARPAYGGQAVLEGVMIRGRKALSTAVRLPDGKITVRSRLFTSLTERVSFLGRPFIRGPIMLWESLSIGMQELFYSVEQVGGEDEKISRAEAIITMTISGVLAVGLFFVLPTILVNWLGGSLGRGIWLNLMEAVVRLSILLLYITAISRMEDIKSFLAYHGAEHRVINGWEDGADLSPAGVAPYSIIHRRCGTSFLVLVAVVSFLVFALFGWPGVVQRLILRLLGIPVIAGLAYEIIRLAGRGFAPAVILASPGMLLQRLTTREPDDMRVEVALAALEGVRRCEEAEVEDHARQA